MYPNLVQKGVETRFHAFPSQHTSDGN